MKPKPTHTAGQIHNPSYPCSCMIDVHCEVHAKAHALMAQRDALLKAAKEVLEGGIVHIPSVTALNKLQAALLLCEEGRGQ